jgi:hypothetical protein
MISKPSDRQIMKTQLNSDQSPPTLNPQNLTETSLKNNQSIPEKRQGYLNEATDKVLKMLKNRTLSIFSQLKLQKYILIPMLKVQKKINIPFII